MSSDVISGIPTCFLVFVHANGPGLRCLPILQTVVDVGGLPAGIFPVLDILVESKEKEKRCFIICSNNSN